MVLHFFTRPPALCHIQQQQVLTAEKATPEKEAHKSRSSASPKLQPTHRPTYLLSDHPTDPLV